MGGEAARGNLDFYCSVVSDPDLAQLPPDERSAIMSDRVMRGITHPGVRRVLDVVAEAAPAQRYEILQRGAWELGVPDWQCPALERIWSEAAQTSP